MLASTKRGMTKECPRCGAPPEVRCKTPKGNNMEEIIHAVRRDLFYIDSGQPKQKLKKGKNAQIS